MKWLGSLYFYIAFNVAVDYAGNQCLVGDSHFHCFFLNAHKIMTIKPDGNTAVFFEGIVGSGFDSFNFTF
ncbi:MAG: hypothetical protein HY920_04815 [Elusimicrobia bacterium]|nr:hypothetical protein [Elusimicrobiota bacterium]